MSVITAIHFCARIVELLKSYTLLKFRAGEVTDGRVYYTFCSVNLNHKTIDHQINKNKNIS